MEGSYISSRMSKRKRLIILCVRTTGMFKRCWRESESKMNHLKNWLNIYLPENQTIPLLHIYPKWSQHMYLSKDVSRNEYSSLIHNRMKQGKKQTKSQVFITSKVEKINCAFFKQKNTVQPFTNKPQLHAKAWIKLPNNFLYKIIQTEKRKYYMSPLILKVPKQTKLKCTVWSQQSLLCLESGGGNWHIKYSFEMLIIVIFLIWVLVTQTH